MCTVQFAAGEGWKYVVVGVVKGWQPREQKWDDAALLTFRLVPAYEGGRRDQLQFVHRVCFALVARESASCQETMLTAEQWLMLPLGPFQITQTTIENLPTALAAFQGKLLAGVGRVLRLYDLGKRKLLRKCENKVGRDGEWDKKSC